MTVGIDKLSFFVPPYYIDMTDLANARGVDPNKFHIGIGQDQMAINAKSQDIVTFAANAAKEILTDNDLSAIDTVIVATESGIDESKATSVILQRLLGIQPFARSFEIKEACYGATAGLQFAKNHVALHPESKVLVVATDIARYGLQSGGEPTQGAGAVAMLITANPRILVLNDDSTMLTQDIYDFWRPIGHEYPLVDGPLSNETYIASFQKVWNQSTHKFKRTLADYDALAFHIPYTKMGKKALLSILDGVSEDEQTRLLARYEESIVYSRRTGNLYTGSLYLGLISLIENSNSLKPGDTIGMFSYGSGAVAEFFSGELVEGYTDHLKSDHHLSLLNDRQQLTIEEYETMFNDKLIFGESIELNDLTAFSLSHVTDSIRYYRTENT